MKGEMDDRKDSMLKDELKTTTSATRLQDRDGHMTEMCHVMSHDMASE